MRFPCLEGEGRREAPGWGEIGIAVSPHPARLRCAALRQATLPFQGRVEQAESPRVIAKPTEVEVAVIGGGPAGLTAAVALASAGVETALVSPPPRPDNRTTALLMGSVTALETLGVWERCRGEAAALRVMRIVDATARLLRAPEVSFSAAEIGCEAFGYNIENRHLAAALAARAAELSALRRIDEAAESIAIADAGATIRLAGGGRVRTRLVVAADGRNSLCRTAAGIPLRTSRYPQTALTMNLGHTRPHQEVSTEFHTEGGPFTLVPLPGRRSSLVWVTEPAEADRIRALAQPALGDEIERRSHSILGKIALEPGCGVFPLEFATADSFGARRIALIGEAAHVIPPIGAQGLNLGLRDGAAISELAVAARRLGGDVGSTELLRRYDRQRRADVTSRALAVDLLNRSLLTDFLPVQGLRGLGLYLADQIGPLRRAVMREGIAPSTDMPRLMRGEAL
jgi:2-octaprenyl-6-methoxyphenol hydroxylase